MERVYAVIMAGGVGSRFWPASRAKNPKQLLDLIGDGRSMLAATVDRLRPDIPPERVLVVTGEITAKEVAEDLPQVPRANILAEPTGRNTAPCIGWAALHVRRLDSKGVLAVMPSDHLIADRARLLAGIRLAAKEAQKGELVTFGVRPDRPETGFGYIEMGEETTPGVHEVKRFVEKPDLKTAQKYLDAGNFAWNSGMFFFTAETILKEMARQMPELMQGLREIDSAMAAGKEDEAVKRIYPALPSQSIDYGIMEGASGIKCLPVDFGWSDLGSWAAAYDLSARNESGNAIKGDAIEVDAENCLVRVPKDKLVALVGVSDLVVVDTGDCLLVCDKRRVQKVKNVVEELKSRGRNDLL